MVEQFIKSILKSNFKIIRQKLLVKYQIIFAVCDFKNNLKIDIFLFDPVEN